MFSMIDPFVPNASFLYPLKTSEKWVAKCLLSLRRALRNIFSNNMNNFKSLFKRGLLFVYAETIPSCFFQ